MMIDCHVHSIDALDEAKWPGNAVFDDRHKYLSLAMFDDDEFAKDGVRDKLHVCLGRLRLFSASLSL